jgi:hypothetical protein
MSYLKNTNNFVETLRKKYTNIKILKTNILPFLNILKKINKQNYTTLNTLYKSL